MKYIINEEQEDRLKKLIIKLLNKKIVEGSNFICKINVYDVDEEEKDYEKSKGLLYDIYVVLNQSSIPPTSGIYGLKKGIEHKIKWALKDWLGIDEKHFFIGFYSEHC